MIKNIKQATPVTEKQIKKALYMAKYYGDHREERRGYQVRYGVDHVGEIKSRCAKYYVNHLGEIKEKNAKYYAANAEKQRARTAAYRIAHPGKARDYYYEHLGERKAYTKAYYVAHREQKMAQHSTWHDNHRKEIRSSRLMSKYGLSKLEFDGLLEKQSSVCAICGKGDWSGGVPQVDHDHITGKVRGILCPKCNWGLGSFEDSISVLQKAIVYLGGQ